MSLPNVPPKTGLPKVSRIYGVAFIVIVIIWGVCGTPFMVAVTVICPMIGNPVSFVGAVHGGIAPLPLAPNPIATLSLVHA